MFAVLPDLTPRESHSLWYTSSRHPSSLFPTDHSASAGENTTTLTNPTTTTPGAIATQNTPAPNPTAPVRGPAQQSASATAQIIDRSLLGRLHAEEQLFERRRAAVTNLGSTWLKPPGVTKTLFQMREERREAEEHAEAMRREMLAQELAAAEAEAAAEAQQAAAMQAAGEGGDDDLMGEDGGRDLDDEIPDAEDEGFGYDGISDDDDEEEEDEEEDEDEEEEVSDEEEGMSTVEIQQRRQEIAHMREREERMRQMMVRGAVQRAHALSNLYSGEEDIDDDERGDLLDEDNLYQGEAHQGSAASVMEAGPDMDMDADLDDDIPEGGDVGYEHTDSEVSLDSDGHDLSYARSSRTAHHRGGHRSSLRRSQAPRSSLDISGFLSRDGSSIVGSSPHIRRGNY